VQKGQSINQLFWWWYA